MSGLWEHLQGNHRPKNGISPIYIANVRPSCWLNFIAHISWKAVGETKGCLWLCLENKQYVRFHFRFQHLGNVCGMFLFLARKNWKRLPMRLETVERKPAISHVCEDSVMRENDILRQNRKYFSSFFSTISDLSQPISNRTTKEKN